MKRALMILALVTSIAAVVGVGATLDSRYAKSAVLSQVSSRLENKIDSDRMNDLQAKMWDMEDRWAARFEKKYDRIHDDMDELLFFMTKEDRERYRELEQEYEKLREKNRQKEDGDD